MMKKFILFFVVLVAALLFVVYYITIPYDISGRGMIVPHLEWRVEKAGDGNIVNVVRDNYSNSITSYSYIEFQRGDHASLWVNTPLVQGDSIQKGDTVAIIRSYEEEIELIKLKGDLERQRMQLKLHMAGSKPEAIKIAQEQVTLAQQEYETQSRFMERAKALHEQGIISDERFEREQRDYLQRKQRVTIAQANYQDLVAGSQPEELAVIRSNIRSLENQIAGIKQRVASFTIRAPFSGIVIKSKSNGSSNEPIVRVATANQIIVVLPIELYQLPYIWIGQPVTLTSTLWKQDMQATIERIDTQVEQRRQRQIIYVTVIANDIHQPVLANMMIEGTIHCGDIPFSKFILRMFRTVYEN